MEGRGTSGRGGPGTAGGDVGSDVQRQDDRDERRPTGRARHDEGAVDGPDALGQAGEPAVVPLGVGHEDHGSADAVVADLEAQGASAHGDTYVHARGLRVLDRVGEQLGDAEVGDGLDGLGRPCRRGARQADVEMDRERAARRERLECQPEPVVEGRRVDAAGQLAQLDESLLGRRVGCGDEVDAPLDDANTERYANLVRHMSEHTQFLFISHNKIAMQMAKQLVGVTMQEQGVSRIVAVDIDSAMQMANETV